MSVYDIAADQLKCVRALSVILADGTLTMPDSWHIHTYPDFDPAITPTLEGFFHAHPAPTVAELRALIEPYAAKFGLAVEEKPHGNGGMAGLHATGRWSGIDLKIWGPARPEGGAQ